MTTELTPYEERLKAAWEVGSSARRPAGKGKQTSKKEKAAEPDILVDGTSAAILHLRRSVDVLITCYGRRLESNERDGQHLIEIEPGSARPMPPESLGLLDAVGLLLSELNKRRSR